ncbi:MAG: tetratricopeptide repeat protein [Pirellulaceae bacterium]
MKNLSDDWIKIWDAHKQCGAATRRSRENATTNSTRRRTAAPQPVQRDSAMWSPTGERAAWRVEGHAVAIGDPTSTEDVLKFNTGHSKVFAVAWGPQGKRLATAGGSGEIKLWRVHGWQQLHTLRGHRKDRYVSTLAWTRDGRRLASGGWDQTVKIWDTEEGREICSLIGHTDCIRSVAWSPGGKRLASTSKDGALKMWDPAIGSEVLSLRGRGHSLMVTWSADGQRLIARHDETITAWDASADYEYASSPAYALDRAPELYRRAVRLARNGHARESDEAFNEARELHADFPAAYLARGKAYEESGNLAEALADYNKTIEIDPTLETGHRYRAELHLRRGDAHEAIKDAKNP